MCETMLSIFVPADFANVQDCYNADTSKKSARVVL